MNKINTPQLVALLASKTGKPNRVAETFVKAFIETTITKANECGTVKVQGFGTFKINSVSDRESVNVANGQRFTIAGYNKLVFTPDRSIAEHFNNAIPPLPPIAPNEEPAEVPAEVPAEEPAEEPKAFIASMAPIAPVESVTSKVEEATPVEEEPKTEEQQDCAEEPPVPPIETPAPQEEPSASTASNKQHRGVWMILSAVIVALVIIAIALATGGDDNNQTGKQNQTAAKETPRLSQDELAKTTTTTQPEKRVHILQKGESLTTISVAYYGTADSMRAIWKLNQFEDPNNIPLGTEILLP